MRTHSPIHRLFQLLGALLVASFIAGPLHAQMQVGSGHALDGSLRVGDSGYNYTTYRGGGSGLSSPAYVPAYSQARAAAAGSGAYAGIGRQYSAYTGGAGQGIGNNRVTNYDVYLNDRTYQAGWQTQSRGYSSYSGPPGGSGSSSSAGAYRINTRMQ